ncbi:MAG: FkbM family methyltransferase [Flavobacterium sp.]|nr:MAG: FkbM family methyltransferase [Flavobacterium sp.]
MIHSIIRKILRREPFKGQFRIFSWLYNSGRLKNIKTIAKPITGNFRIHLNTRNYIECAIYYIGDYEFTAKQYFKKYINKGNTIIDVGANIGFHTLYFAELTGMSGKVIAIEPIPVNIRSLRNNVALNGLSNVQIYERAFANENKTLNIHIDQAEKNPGSFNLYDHKDQNTEIICVKGDDLLNEIGAGKIDFIKIDVEGYEFEALKGLKHTLEQSKPIIIFEFDRNYQLKNAGDPAEIFNFLVALSYSFQSLSENGIAEPFSYSESIMSTLIIATPIGT